MQNMPTPRNDQAIFQLNYRIRKEIGPGSIRASNAPPKTHKGHESRAAIVAVLNTELLGEVAHTVFVVSTERPDVIDAHPDLIH
jgi:hypothetical protein